MFDVKSDGWFNVFHAAHDMPIGSDCGVLVGGGPVRQPGTNRLFGCERPVVQDHQQHAPRSAETRALALDWTAWGGIGMATRGSIPKIMEMAGVQMLPPEAGVAWIQRELTGGDHRGEVIVAGQLGMMAAEYDDQGGVDPRELVTDDGTHGPMVATATMSVHDGVVTDVTLDPTEQPFLNDHRIDGTPVLPGVMGMEAFAEAAHLLAPEHHVLAVEDVTFAAPLKFYRDEPRTLRVSAVVQPDGDELVAHCQLSAERLLPGNDTPQRTVHFTGRVRMGSDPVAAATSTPPGEPSGPTLDAGRVYSFYFHGPAYQVVSTAGRTGESSVATLADPLPDNHVTADAPLVTAPRLIELCFQAAGLWQAGRDDQLALPSKLAERCLRWRSGNSGRSAAGGRHRDVAGEYTCVVVDESGTVFARLDGYQTIALPAPIPDDIAADLHAAYRG